MHTPFLLFLPDIGGGEMILILVAILVLFGANKIPELARGLGKGMREFKDASREIRSEIENAGQPGYQNQPNNYQNQYPQQGYQQPTHYQPAPPTPAAPVAYQPTGLDQPTADAVPSQPVTPAAPPRDTPLPTQSV